MHLHHEIQSLPLQYLLPHSFVIDAKYTSEIPKIFRKFNSNICPSLAYHNSFSKTEESNDGTTSFSIDTETQTCNNNTNILAFWDRVRPSRSHWVDYWLPRFYTGPSQSGYKQLNSSNSLRIL